MSVKIPWNGQSGSSVVLMPDLTVCSACFGAAQGTNKADVPSGAPSRNDCAVDGNPNCESGSVSVSVVEAFAASVLVTPGAGTGESLPTAPRPTTCETVSVFVNVCPRIVVAAGGTEHVVVSSPTVTVAGGSAAWLGEAVTVADPDGVGVGGAAEAANAKHTQIVDPAGTNTHARRPRHLGRMSADRPIAGQSCPGRRMPAGHVRDLAGIDGPATMFPGACTPARAGS